MAKNYCKCHMSFLFVMFSYLLLFKPSFSAFRKKISKLISLCTIQYSWILWLIPCVCKFANVWVLVLGDMVECLNHSYCWNMKHQLNHSYCLKHQLNHSYCWNMKHQLNHSYCWNMKHLLNHSYCWNMKHLLNHIVIAEIWNISWIIVIAEIWNISWIIVIAEIWNISWIIVISEIRNISWIDSCYSFFVLLGIKIAESCQKSHR